MGQAMTGAPAVFVPDRDKWRAELALVACEVERLGADAIGPMLAMFATAETLETTMVVFARDPAAELWTGWWFDAIVGALPAKVTTVMLARPGGPTVAQWTRDPAGVWTARDAAHAAGGP